MSTLALANVEALANLEGIDPNEGKGMKKEKCYKKNANDELIQTGQKCVRSDSHTDICHYTYDQWGRCD